MEGPLVKLQLPIRSVINVKKIYLPFLSYNRVYHLTGHMHNLPEDTQLLKLDHQVLKYC